MIAAGALVLLGFGGSAEARKRGSADARRRCVMTYASADDKYDGEVPDALLQELKEAADTASELDSRMERLHRELHG